MIGSRTLLHAQELTNHALGVRGGIGFYGAGLELSYQKKFDETRRFEIDMGWRKTA